MRLGVIAATLLSLLAAAAVAVRRHKAIAALAAVALTPKSSISFSPPPAPRLQRCRSVPGARPLLVPPRATPAAIPGSTALPTQHRERALAQRAGRLGRRRLPQAVR